MTRVRIIKEQTGLESVGTIVNLNDDIAQELLSSGAVELVDQATAPSSEEPTQDAPPADVVAQAPAEEPVQEPAPEATPAPENVEVNATN